MENCKKCGKELSVDAKFCTSCGTNRVAGVENPAQETISQASNEGANENLDKVKHVTSSYGKYLHRSIKEPRLDASESNYNGFISYALITLFSSLAVSHMIALGLNKAVSTMHSFLGSGGGQSAGPVFPGWLRIFLFFAITCMIPAVISLVATGKSFAGKATIFSAFNRMYTPAAISVYITGIVFVLTFVLTPLSTMWLLLLLGVAFFLINAGFVASLWNGTVNDSVSIRFYKVVGLLIANIIITSIVSSIFLNDVISVLMSKF